MNWIAVRVRPAVNREGALAALFEAGSEGVLEQGDELVTHFPSEVDVSDVQARVLAADPQATFEIRDVPHVDGDRGRRRR